MLWLLLLVLLVLTIGALVFPFLRRKTDTDPQRIDYDVVVYRNQLGEIDQDVERGLMSSEQAAAARTEIHRRMLSAEDAETRMAGKLFPEDNHRMRLKMAGVIAAILVVGSVLMYLMLGAPELPGKPYAERSKNDTEFAQSEEAAQLAAQLETKPSASGYNRLADLYFIAKNYEKALDAYHHALRLDSKNAVMWAGMGETLVMASNGSVVPQAMKAFIRTLELDPQDPRSQFYIGLAESQIGNLKKAVAIWRNLERHSAADASYLPMLREHIAAYATEGKFDPQSVPPEKPPLAALKQAVATMAGAQDSQVETEYKPSITPAAGETGQDSMIRGMVARLAARLEKNPNDADGWVKLARSYKVLGDRDKARDAIEHAKQLKPDDDDVKALAKEIE